MREVGGNLPIYFEPNSVDSIANALIAGIKRTNREELVSSGFVRSKQFSWQKSADLLLKHMSKLAKE
jgi:glycosyltransferase involved in cell wall biosynthesis